MHALNGALLRERQCPLIYIIDMRKKHYTTYIQLFILNSFMPKKNAVLIKCKIRRPHKWVLAIQIDCVDVDEKILKTSQWQRLLNYVIHMRNNIYPLMSTLRHLY